MVHKDLPPSQVRFPLHSRAQVDPQTLGNELRKDRVVCPRVEQTVGAETPRRTTDDHRNQGVRAMESATQRMDGT